jgi:hypothetical protein
MTKSCRLHGPNNSHDTNQCKVIGEQADKMHAQWQARPSYDNKYKKKFNSTKRMDGRPPEANLVERKKYPPKKNNKRPAVLMFEEQDDEGKSLADEDCLAMENFNCNCDKHRLIDEMNSSKMISKIWTRIL